MRTRGLDIALVVPSFLRALLVLVSTTSPAWAGKADTVGRMVTEGQCADAVARVDEWEAKKALGSEEADLVRLRGEAAYCVAKAADSVAGWEAYLARYASRPDAGAARVRLWELAFTAAQAEGTPAALRAFVARYPDAPQVVPARKQEEAWAFDEAARSGDPAAIEAFLASHPESPLRAQAWETLVQKNAGVYLLSPDRAPRRLEPVPVEGDRVTLPPGLPGTLPWPQIGVNVPGAGRGETSEWWSLKAVEYDAEGGAHLTDVAPLGAELAARMGVAAPGREAELMRLVAAPGSHVARVATTKAPLALAGHCPGSGRYALVLQTPGQGAQAFPFGVACPELDERPTGLSLLAEVLDAAERGDRVYARQKWGELAALPEASPLRTWLAGAFQGDPWVALVDARPAVGDWVVWTTQPDGTQLSGWLRTDDQGARVLAVRPGWTVIANGALRSTIGEPACARLAGSLGASLFCAAGEAPRVVSPEGSPLPLSEPPAEALAAVGLAAPLPPGAVLAAGPRLQGQRLVGWWRVRTSVQVDVVGEAPAAWTEALAPTPALLRWLEANAGSGPFGVGRVDAQAAILYRSFTGG